MGILLTWCFFALLVGVAANSRGRNGAGWFIIAVAISPLIAILLLLCMRNLRQEQMIEKLAGPRQVAAPTYFNPTRTEPYNALPKARWGGKATRVTIDRTPKPFEPEGVYAGIPYRVAEDGGIEAIMQGAKVRFSSLEKFTGAVGQAQP